MKLSRVILKSCRIPIGYIVNWGVLECGKHRLHCQLGCVDGKMTVRVTVCQGVHNDKMLICIHVGF